RMHTFPSVALKLTLAPSSTNASALCGASVAMNCGRKARKKSATFGFSTLVRKPCTKIRDSDAGGGASAAALCDRVKSSVAPRETRYAAPVHLGSMNGVGG